MNTIEHLLMCLAEEGCEIAQDCSKINRFGIDDVYTHIDAETGEHTRHPEKGTNRERLIDELNDIAGVVRLLVEYGAIPPDWGDADKQLAKMEKVKRYMKYAHAVGTLEGTA